LKKEERKMMNYCKGIVMKVLLKDCNIMKIILLIKKKNPIKRAPVKRGRPPKKKK
jgi:hypothetical protein